MRECRLKAHYSLNHCGTMRAVDWYLFEVAGYYEVGLATPYTQTKFRGNQNMNNGDATKLFPFPNLFVKSGRLYWHRLKFTWLHARCRVIISAPSKFDNFIRKWINNTWINYSLGSKKNEHAIKKPFARWRHFTTRIRILHGFVFLCKQFKVRLLLFKPSWDYQRWCESKNEKDCGLNNKITPSCKWPTVLTEYLKS